MKTKGAPVLSIIGQGSSKRRIVDDNQHT